MGGLESTRAEDWSKWQLFCCGHLFEGFPRDKHHNILDQEIYAMFEPPQVMVSWEFAGYYFLIFFPNNELLAVLPVLISQVKDTFVNRKYC